MARAMFLAQARRMGSQTSEALETCMRPLQGAPARTALCRAVLALGFSTLIAAGPVRADAGTDLTKLVRDYGAAEQKIRPRSAAERGDSRYLDGYDESATATYLAARRRINEDSRARLDRIDAAALKAQDGLTFQIFRWDLEDEARELN